MPTDDPILALVASLREALSRMTPGPWSITPNGIYLWSNSTNNFVINDDVDGLPDMEGIVAIVNALPQLLDALTARTEETRRLRGAVISLQQIVADTSSTALVHACKAREVADAALTAPTEEKGGRDAE